MAEVLDRKAGRPGAWSGSVFACVRTGGMSLILDAAELATRAALSAGLSRFIDILRKNPHFPDFEVDELAVIPIGAERLSSMGEEIRLVLLLEAILASREDEAVGIGR